MFYDSSSVEWWQFLYTFGIMWATGLMAAGLMVSDRETAMRMSESWLGKVILIWTMGSILITGNFTVLWSYLVVLAVLVQNDVVPMGALVIVAAWFALGLWSFGAGMSGRLSVTSP